MQSETNNLTDDELDLLKWLSTEDFSQYGECHGKDLDGLIAKGLAQVHGPGEGQGGFIAKDYAGTKGMMYRAVSLTEAGIAMVVSLQGPRPPVPAPPELPSGEFSVYQFFPTGMHECVADHVDMKTAVDVAHSYTIRPAAKIGTIAKVIITDGGDFTNFMWEFGKGVTYPPRDASGKFVADGQGSDGD